MRGKETDIVNVFLRRFCVKETERGCTDRVQSDKFERDVGNAVIMSCSRKRDKSMMLGAMTVIDIVVISADLH